MKVLIISDVHSNFRALEAVEKQEKTWDKLLFVGDAVDFGFQPHECLTWLREHGALCVQGNHDEGFLCRLNEGFRSMELDKTEHFWQHNLSLMTDQDIDFLRSFPVERIVGIDGITYYMMHIYQHEFGDDNALNHQMKDYNVVDRAEKYWREKVGVTGGKRVFLVGDSHRCGLLQLRKDLIALNPGSLAYRLGADTYYKGGDYIVVEDGIPYFRFVSYDTTEDYADICARPFTGHDKNAGMAIFRPEN